MFLPVLASYGKSEHWKWILVDEGNSWGDVSIIECVFFRRWKSDPKFRRKGRGFCVCVGGSSACKGGTLFCSLPSVLDIFFFMTVMKPFQKPSPGISSLSFSLVMFKFDQMVKSHSDIFPPLMYSTTLHKDF